MMKEARKTETGGIVDAVIQLLESKNIDRQDFQEVVQEAFISVLKKRFDSEENFSVTFNMDKGDIEIYREWTVVADGEVENEHLEMELTRAQTHDPDIEAGDDFVEIIDYRTFGRRAILNLKQALMHKIREIEKNAVYEEYKDRVGEIIHADVHQVDRNRGVILNIDRVEFRMPSSEQVKSEKYHRGLPLRVLIKDVRRENNRDPEIIVSRSDPNFVRRLFEVEVPEIADGIIHIRKIARVPGRRTKIAVESSDSRIDPVGSCVGMKGVRIQAIVKELHDEKIDIIEWSQDPVVYISKAISPARVSGVYLTEAEKTATVVVMEDQLSLAIGRDGQNARLAAKLTGWRIDIKSVVEAASDTLSKLQADAAFAATAAHESTHFAQLEQILAKKSEGRPVTPEEYQALAQFVDRVERRQYEKQRADEQAAELARQGISPRAFEQPLDVFGLPEHVYTILTEAEYRTAGDLLVVMKSTPDKVLTLPGIGSKAKAAIEKAVADFTAPIVVVEEAPVVAPVEESPVETVTQVEAPVEVAVEAPVAEVNAGETVPAPAEEEADVSFEEMFKMRPETVQPGSEEEDADKKDKKGKKGKKSVEYEFDEDRGEVVGHKKHKRGSDDWGDGW